MAAKKSKKRVSKSPGDKSGKQRLQKVLAAAGIDSRRNCEELILQGEVTVNGKVINSLPAFVDPDKDTIVANGRKIRAVEKVYYLLNKPKSVICTNSDPQGRRKAIDLINTPDRIFCVGRLDFDTTGLIILTNDSELANRLTHPRYELSKVYEVTLREPITGEAIEKLKKGTFLAEGKTSKAALKVLKRSKQGSLVEITIRQGLNRQIRRMFARVGYKVKALRRTKIGSIGIKGLGVGKYKNLAEGQVAYLMNVTSSKSSTVSKK